MYNLYDAEDEKYVLMNEIDRVIYLILHDNKQYASLQQLTLDVFMQYCDVYVAMGCISGSWVEKPFVVMVKSVTTS